MNVLRIYVDSSTKPSNGTKYGESIAAWMLKYDRSTIITRCGVAYFHRSGPNKTFYEGINGALESALLDANNGTGDPIAVYGDCQPVINQLNNVWRVGVLQPYYNRVRALERRFKKRVTYHYLGETDMAYKKVDQLSKRAHGLFKGVLK